MGLAASRVGAGEDGDRTEGDEAPPSAEGDRDIGREAADRIGRHSGDPKGH